MNVDPLRIPIRRLRFCLRLTTNVRLPVHHGQALHGLVTRALGCKPFPRQLAVVCCEGWSVKRTAGQEYSFGLVGLGPRGVAMLDAAHKAIARRGATPHRGGEGTLDGCYEVGACEELAEPEVDHLSSQLRQESGPLLLRFRTPVNLRRPRHNIRGGLSYVNRMEFPAEVLLRALVRRAAEAVGDDATPDGADWQQGMPAIPVALGADPSRMINICFRVPAAATGSAPRTSNPIEGVQGLLRLTDVPEEWLPFIAFGSVAQVGSSVGYGLGRYDLERGKVRSVGWCLPAMTLGDFAFAPARLASAAQRVRDNADVRHDGWMPDTAVLDAEVTEAVARARDPASSVGPMHGVLIPKKSGGVRALAIPSPAMRVLQRAVYETLDPDIDELFEESSYAFRKGRSVKRAAQAIRRAERDGFNWVLDADITSFFDNVDWSRLADIVDGALAGDPICPLLLKWMRAPVRLAGREYSRTRGLPQGAPLSPLLANLYLDVLDEQLISQGFRVVRYADDFVVLCRSDAQARTAKREVERELGALGLVLNADKTRLVVPGEGYQFLGLQFGSAASDEPERTAEDSRASVAVPAGSWLEAVPMADLRRITERLRLRIGEPEARVVPPADEVESRREEDAVIAAWGGQKRPVFIVQREAQVTLSGEKLVIRSAEVEMTSLPLRGISHITLLGATRMSFPLALRCADLGVPVYCCYASGKLRGAIAPPPDWTALRRQLEAANDEAFCLAFARSIISAKLHNAATLVVRFDIGDSSSRGAELRALRDSCLGAASVAQLLGLEGRGARSYFEAWAAVVAPEWRFSGRRKHPAPDPVNAMLSLAYTILHHHVGTALVSAGLDPRVGVLHRQRGLHHALASDVQEEFRFLAESAVWSLLHRPDVKPADFIDPGSGAPPMLSDDLRRLIVRTVESRIFTSFTPPGGAKQTYREFIDRQARAVGAAFHAAAGTYVSFRLKA